jgi:hypothetical protein
MNSTLRRRCGVLGIPFDELYERAVTAMRADLAAAVVADELPA